MTLRNVMAEVSSAISTASEFISEHQAEKALELLIDCSNRNAKVILSGVGKSGIIARKIAATFTSIGLTAIFLNPLDALHGDLGVVGSQDVCILLSNSGESDELYSIADQARTRGSQVIGILGNINSSLASRCCVVLHSYVAKEICPLNLAPTASTSVAMSIGDALAVLWMEKLGISSQDFARNHPSGALGKRLTTIVGHIMKPLSELIPLYPSSSIVEVVSTLTQNGIGCSHVVDSSSPTRLLGIITDGDLRRALQTEDINVFKDVVAAQIMTPNPMTVYVNELAIDAVKLMEGRPEGKISSLPVVDENGDLHGIVQLHELIKLGL